MVKIGITGQAGFIGTHLYNYFGTKKEEIGRIPFKDEYFEDEKKLESFVSQCDVIIHLAAVNRHNEPQIIYKTNIDLVKKLINALDKTKSKPHVLFSSSTQEDRDNIFGQSKREGRELLRQWAIKNKAVFTGMIIPNVFGPFGRPFYNSVVATFSHQLTHNEEPKIEIDAQLKLIYVGDLVKDIYNLIKNRTDASEFRLSHNVEMKVTEILELLKSYKSSYFDKGIFPDLTNEFEKNLFNTFVCYMDLENHFPVLFKQNTDDRGNFTEILKLKSGGQISFSTTKPGITRGNHYHTRKAERFSVIKGKARLDIRRIGTDKVYTYEIDGNNNPGYVDMPIWHTHNITNTGNDEVYTIFWINEFYNQDDADTYFETV